MPANVIDDKAAPNTRKATLFLPPAKDVASPAKVVAETKGVVEIPAQVVAPAKDE